MQVLEMIVLQSTSRSHSEQMERSLEKPKEGFVKHELNNKNLSQVS